MGAFIQDIRHTLRGLRKQPGVVGVVLLTLGLALGATTAIFSVVNAVLLRPLPYEDPNALVMIEGNYLQLDMERIGASPPEFVDYRQQTRAFERLAAFNHVDFNLSDARPERISGARASADLFGLLRGEPILGRTFLPEEEQPGRENTVVLSYGLWQRRFGGSPGAVGGTLELDGTPYTVVGVMPPGFQFPYPGMPSAAPADLWVPLSFTDEQLGDRGRYSLRVIARLRPGVTLEQAQAEMNVVASRFEQQYASDYRGPKGEDGGWRVSLVPLRDEIVGDVGPTLVILFCAVGLVLLVACANVANLSLVRVSRRQREIAVRMAVGAGRLRIVRQLLTESLVLALLGGAVGIALALGGTNLLLALAPSDLPRVDEVGLDGRVLGFALVASLVAGAIFGLASALEASRADLGDALKEAGQGTTEGVGRSRLRGLLVVAEVSLAVMLVVGAGLLVKSLARLERVDLGFDARDVLTLQITLPRTRYPEAHQQRDFFRNVLARVKGLPGVRSAGAVTLLPLSGSGMSGPVSIEGRPFDTARPTFANYRIGSPEYFDAMGMRLVAGRTLAESDGEGAPVVVVNDTLAREFFPGEDPIGKRLKLGAPTAPRPWLTVAGIVGDVSDRALGSPSRPEMYVSYLQEPSPTMALAIRTETDPAALVGATRDAVLAVDPNEPIYGVRTMEELLSSSISRRRFSALLFGIFAAAALALAVVGVYGVISYAVAQRTREIGVRVALGARPGDVLRLVVGQGARLVLLGLALGIVGAAALTRFLESMLYGVSATDPWTFAGASTLLAGVALLATFIPARQASRIDPVIALRSE